MSAVEAGTIIDERYRVSARLGSGGMAEVYLAQDTLLGRQVALKLLHHRFAEDQEFVERFRREASSAAGLSHPNVVAVFDRGEWDGTYYIAMEYLPGRSLKAVVREHGALSPQDATDIVVQILLATRFAHKRGIIHRDIKPHNVILDEEGRAKVTDFGIARAGASDMTLTGSIMGTAQYLSPEQAQGHAVSESSDLYAVGVVLYELLTGQVPFEGESPVTVALKQVSVEPVPPGALNPAVTPALEAVVMRSLAKDPAARFVNADEFIAALQQAREGVAPAPAFNGAPPTQDAAALLVPPVPPDEGTPADVAKRRKRALWTVAAVALLAIAAVAALLLLKPAKSGQRDGTQSRRRDPGGGRLVAAPRRTGSGRRARRQRARAHRPGCGQHPAWRHDRRQGLPRERGRVLGSRGDRRCPNVNGKSSSEAVKILREAGFQPTTQSQASESVEKGRVISTDPSAGIEVQVGSPVTVLVSSGPQGSERARSDWRNTGRRDSDPGGRWAEGGRVQARSRRTGRRHGHLADPERGHSVESGRPGDDRRGPSAQEGGRAFGGGPERSPGDGHPHQRRILRENRLAHRHRSNQGGDRRAAEPRSGAQARRPARLSRSRWGCLAQQTTSTSTTTTTPPTPPAPAPTGAPSASG